MANYFVSSASGAGGGGTGASWANAYLTMTALLARPILAGDTVWVGDDHNETQASLLTLGFPGTTTAPNYIYCVDHTIASPAAANLKVGAAGAGSITTTGTSGLTVNGCFYCYGVYFQCASGGTLANMNMNGTAGQAQTYEKCGFFSGTTVASVMAFSVGATATHLIDCILKWAAVGTVGIAARGALRLTRCTVDTSTATPTNFINANAASRLLVEDCDLSGKYSAALCNNITVNGPIYFCFRRCRLASGAILTAQTGNSSDGWIIDLSQCDSGTIVSRNEHHMPTGSQTTATNLARSGGAVDSGTNISWKMITTNLCAWVFPFVCNPAVVWNDNVTSVVNITMEGIADPRDFAAIPKNDEVWIEAEYLGFATDPRGVIRSGTKPTNLDTGTALTASTQAWDNAVPLRINLTAYSVGALIKLASNPGRVFICTTAGTSAGSEPVGYASAVDGGTVTDGASAIFKAMWRFKQSVTTAAAPSFAGYVYVTPKVGKASMVGGIYVDPIVTLS